MINRFFEYPAYCDSGVEWLGDVPADWVVMPLKFVIRSGKANGALIKGQMHPEPDDGLFPGYSASGQDIWVDVAEHERPGIVLSAVGARCGKTFKADGKWTAIANTHVFFAQHGNDRDFLWYLTNDENFWERSGTAQPFVRVSTTLQRLWCFPSIAEQRGIVAYLDRETGRIDALIGKKEGLIGVLRERRGALISRVVTKGLDSSARMKDSGVEWLGEIPSGWEVTRLKRNFSVVNGATPKSDEPENWDGDIVWVTPEDLGRNAKQFLSDSERRITKRGYDSCGTTLAPNGSLVLSTRAPIGHLAIADTEFCTNQGCRALIRSKKANEEFFYYQLLAAHSELLSWGTGSTFRELTKQKLEYIWLAVPPLTEQREIAAYLDRETGKIDALIGKVEGAIALLREYRAALISAAVTGKIDVREREAA